MWKLTWNDKIVMKWEGVLNGRCSAFERPMAVENAHIWKVEVLINGYLVPSPKSAGKKR